MEGKVIPGTAQIRKIGASKTGMELLELSGDLAEGGYDKKLFSVLSRVYTEHKGFSKKEEAGMKEHVERIVASSVPSELKMQTFTSFELPFSFVPDKDTIKKWIEECAPKRANIAAFFLAEYAKPEEFSSIIINDKEIFKTYLSAVSLAKLLKLTSEVIENEEKEAITGFIRAVRDGKKYLSYRNPDDNAEIKKLTADVFASKNVFYTTKLIFCMAYNVPGECLPPNRDLYKILRITINYDERTSKEFAKKYHLDFNTSDEAVCGYVLRNRKSEKETSLVSRFATHVVRVQDEGVKRKLLHQAFKRGGMFRLYAGCMQDGYVNEEKQRKFHYSEEQIKWVETLPGLKE